MVHIRSLLFIFLFIVHFCSLAEALKTTCYFDVFQSYQQKTYRFSEREQLASTIYGFNILVDSDDQYVSKQIKQYGCFQPANIYTYSRFLKENEVVLVIGSHIGLSAVVYGKLIGPKGKLIIVEPYSTSFEITALNLKLNDLQDISMIYNKGASNMKGKGHMLVNNQDTSSSLLQEQGNKLYVPKLWKREDVEVDTVDNILKGDKVNVVFIDVQHLQLEVLEGMKNTIMNSHSLRMVIKWSGFSLEKSQQEFLSAAKNMLIWLQNQKFNFYKLKRQFDWLPPQDCNDQRFQKLTIQQVLDFTTKRKTIIDLIIVSTEIDPNNLH